MLWLGYLILLHSERPKLYGVLAVLSAKGLMKLVSEHPVNAQFLLKSVLKFINFIYSRTSMALTGHEN